MYRRVFSFALIIFALAALCLPYGGKAFREAHAVTQTTGDPLVNADSGNRTENSGGSVGISANPEHLTGEGDVTISITITNTNSPAGGGIIGGDAMLFPTSAPSDSPSAAPSDVPVIGPGAYTNVRISNDYGVVFQTSDIPAGNTVTFSAVMHVNSDQIGVNLTFAVEWLDTGTNTQYSRNLEIMITRSDTAYLTLTRTMSSSSAEAGETVVLKYVMVNTGSLTLNNVTLTDPGIAGDAPMLAPFTLESGKSVRFEYSYTMGNESVVSSPTATFIPAGSTNKLTVSASRQTIGLINAQLSKDIVIGDPTPDGIRFTLYLINNGNQRLQSLTVKDDLGKTIESGFGLAIGETKIIEYFIPNPDATRYVVFYITGTDASGSAFSDNTLSYAVHPYVDPSLLGLDLKVETRTQLSQENIIGLTFTVTNTGTMEYTDLSLTEQVLGYELYHIESLSPSSEGVVFNVDVNAGSERELIFILTANDHAGNPHTCEAHVTASYFDPNAAAPNDPPEKPDTSIAEDPKLGSKLDGLLTSTGKALSSWYYVLIAVAAISGIVILTLTAVEIRLRRNARPRKGNSRD